MNAGSRILRLILCSALVFISGCAAWEMNELSAALPLTGPEKTLKELEKITPSQRDKVQYLLNRGILNLYVADLTNSRKDLEEAKAIILALQAVSLSENMAAFSTNELLRSYGGSPSDKVLVHVMLALGYLMSDDLDGARVEMLQADITMRQQDDGKTNSGQLASARFISGIVYELGGEFDDALISYHRTYQILKERNEAIPLALQTSLLTLSRQQGRIDEYQRYSQQFNREAPAQKNNEGVWFVIYFDGLVSRKTEARISVYAPGANTMVSIVTPRYTPSKYRPTAFVLRADGSDKKTQIIENNDLRAREDLNKEKGKILAAATVRAVAKYTAAKNAQQQDPLVGALINLAGLVSEQADVRSWNMLPASIQIARVPVKLDDPMEVLSRGQSLPALGQLTTGKYGVLLASSLTQRLFSYPVSEAISSAR